VITSTAFVIGLVLVIVLGLDPNTQLRKAAFTGRIRTPTAGRSSYFFERTTDQQATLAEGELSFSAVGKLRRVETTR
jgi:hypothetical protein